VKRSVAQRIRIGSAGEVMSLAINDHGVPFSRGPRFPEVQLARDP
jgi:hypothetical protein